MAWGHSLAAVREGMAERTFVTGVLDVDVPNGSFLTPPYGFGACTSVN